MVRRGAHLVKPYGYLIAVASVAAATAAFYPGRGHFAKGQWAVLYLLVVTLVAAHGGGRPGIVAALLSSLAWDYFFVPKAGAFSVADRRDVLFPFVFLAVAAVMGLQTGRLRQRSAEALARKREATLLHRFSAQLVSHMTVGEMARRLIGEVEAVAHARCAAMFLRADGGGIDGMRIVIGFRMR